MPREVLQEMYGHRRRDHGSDSILPWYDCGICDRLEAEYSESLGWHMENPLETDASLISEMRH
jgi:hypothetical protein